MRFLHPSSGAQNCTYSIVYFVKTLLLPATVMEEMEQNVVNEVFGVVAAYAVKYHY